jgi:hypothetical protein
LLLLAREVSLGLHVVDIPKHIREAFHTIELNNKHLFLTSCGHNSLFRDCLELVWTINKPLTDLVCELKYSDEVAYTEAKTHGGLERSAVIAVHEGKSDGETKESCRIERSIVAVRLARAIVAVAVQAAPDSARVKASCKASPFLLGHIYQTDQLKRCALIY